MAFSAKILKDSVGPNGVRLTTMELTLPRIVLAEFNTHRMFSRNSASSRAIPVEKMIDKVMSDPFIPVYWGKNQKGMQADEELSSDQIDNAVTDWFIARDNAVRSAKSLLSIGVHKQITNRLLEPFMWHTIIVSATEWNNYFALRSHKDAQPEIRTSAIMAKSVYEASVPTRLNAGDYHLPLVDDFDDLLNSGFTMDEIIKISIGRCARVSYLTHDGKRDPKADVELYDRLLSGGHLSPLEHVARAKPITEEEMTWSGNFYGWTQVRKTILNEHDFSKKV